MANEKSRKRLFVAYLCATVVVVALACLHGSHLVRTTYKEQTSRDLEVRARLCSREILELVETDQVDAVDALCKKLGKAIHTRITVILPTGKVIGDTEEDPRKMENHTHRQEIQQALTSAGGVGRSTRYSKTVEETMMYVALALPRGESPDLVVRTSVPITAVTKRLVVIDQTIIAAGLVAVVLIVAVSPWLCFCIGRARQAAGPLCCPDQAPDAVPTGQDDSAAQ
ncbi:MAG: hypothetical protein A2V70_00015 [Planctomycetes bacterium RBG_13_63_9]|nr:MAG: hypothetical protein A2V70_00015 [Planctomycetes bacterium RBG_13_63_9]